MSLDQRFADAMGQLLGPDFPTDIGLAVSGGGDSMAMLYLAHNWAHRWGVRLWVVTVDHGLRPESADEAAMVADECRILGWPHAVLRWHWDGVGNKMDAARRGRLALIGQWRGDVGHVLLAHTRDDVAETYLMRLARGAGLDGLAAMQARRHVVPANPGSAAKMIGTAPGGEGAEPGFDIVRPCLDMGRDELRHYLRALKGRWVEDPSNDDPAYQRVRVRQALASLSSLGLTVDILASVATRLAGERTVAARRAESLWREHGTEVDGTLGFRHEWCTAVERASQRRMLSAALRYVSGAEYPPRAEPLDALLDRVVSGGGGTLHGCDVVWRGERFVVFRELAAVQDVVVIARPGNLWDGRWRVTHDFGEGVTVRPLGEHGWSQLPERVRSAADHRIDRSLPGIWSGDRLLACPPLCFGRQTDLVRHVSGRSCRDFADFLLSH